MQEIIDVIVPDHNFYYKYFDVNPAGESLTADTTVNFVCGSYIYGPEKFYQGSDEAGSIQILGEMTEAAKGLRIVPFASSVLLYDSNDQLQTIISAVYNNSKFRNLTPTDWKFGDTATEESGYIQSQVNITPVSARPLTGENMFRIQLDSGEFTTQDMDKLKKMFHKDDDKN